MSALLLALTILVQEGLPPVPPPTNWVDHLFDAELALHEGRLDEEADQRLDARAVLSGIGVIRGKDAEAVLTYTPAGYRETRPNRGRCEAVHPSPDGTLLAVEWSDGWVDVVARDTADLVGQCRAMERPRHASGETFYSARIGFEWVGHHDGFVTWRRCEDRSREFGLTTVGRGGSRESRGAPDGTPRLARPKLPAPRHLRGCHVSRADPGESR